MRELHALVAESPTGVDAWSCAIGRAGTLWVALGSVVAWVSYNLAAPLIGAPRPDPPPFFWMQRASSLATLLALWLVLAGRKRHQERERAWVALLAAHEGSSPETPEPSAAQDIN